MKLSELSPPRGSRKRRKLLGRGESSGSGKTSGKGGKGQTARTGGTISAGFEGGQMPLVRRVPKLGFVSRQKTLGLNRYAIVDLSVLESFDNASEVNAETLAKKGFKAHSYQKAGIKVLGSQKITKKLTVKVQAVSQSARAQIESAGGTVELITCCGAVKCDAGKSRDASKTSAEKASKK